MLLGRVRASSLCREFLRAMELIVDGGVEAPKIGRLGMRAA